MKENIKQQTYRLAKIAFPGEINEPFQVVNKDPNFRLICNLVRLAKEETRIECAKEAETWAKNNGVSGKYPPIGKVIAEGGN